MGTIAKRAKIVRRKEKSWPIWVWPSFILAVVAINIFLAYLLYNNLIKPTYEYSRNKLIESSLALDLAVKDIYLEGRKFTDFNAVNHAVNIKIGDPILTLDLNKIRKNLENLYWVKYAIVERHLPSTVLIKIIERKPLALWQFKQELKLIDEDGQVIAVPHIEEFLDLPIFVGEDAPYHTSELINLFKIHLPIYNKIESAIRIGERRWNVKFTGGLLLKLPEENIEAALTSFSKLIKENDFEAQKIIMVDLRAPDKIYVKRQGDIDGQTENN